MIDIDYIIVFSVYFFIVLSIGVIASRYTQNTQDFVLGGRKLGSWIVALGAGASDMSGWLLLGLPGAVYLFGFSQVWMPLGLIIGALINWTCVAKRLRIYTERANNSLTIPEFFENRFQDKKGVVRLITSIVVIVFFTLYASSGFVSGAILFKSTFNLPYHEALLIGASVIIVYTCIGGFFAVNWIDLFQGTLMWLALLIVPLMTLWAMHHGQGTAQLVPLHERVEQFMAAKRISIIAIISLLTWGLGYFGQPHILVRFMAAKNPTQIRQSAWICMGWMTMSLVGAVFTGLFGKWYFSGASLIDPESVFLILAKELFNPFVTGTLLAAVLSAVMSTIAAQLLASSSSLAEDIYFRFFKKEETARQGLLSNRIAVLIIALVALYLARDPNSRVLSLVSYAWAGLGASFGPLILCSLFWSRTTLKGGLAGIIVGAGVVIIWKQLTSLGGIFSLYELFPGFLLGGITIMVVSLIDKKPAASIIDIFKQVKQLTQRES